MKVCETSILGLLVIEPNTYEDKRGFFFESYNKNKFDSLVGRDINFVQDNHSKSEMGVLRGLHYQINPKAQAKLVRCVKGSIYDVAVDLRRDSLTCGKWFGIELSELNKKQLWIPEGFAHGFITLENNTEVLYKTNNYYSKDCERSIIWDDSELGIEWPMVPVKISEKDLIATAYNSSYLFSE